MSRTWKTRSREGECAKCGSAGIKQILDLFLAKTARIS